MQTSDTKKINQASLLIALSGMLYGFLGYLGTNILHDNMSISAMLFWRFFIAGIWMMLFAVKSYRAKKVEMSLGLFLFIFLLGAIGYAGSSGFYFVASQSIGTGLAMVIFFSYPIAVMAISALTRKHEFSLDTLITLFLMVLGLILLRDSSSHSFSMPGLGFAILSALCYAGYMLGTKVFSSKAIDANILTTIVCFSCAAMYLMTALATHGFSFPHTGHSISYLLFFGILSTALPIQLMLKGLKYVSSTRASIISVLEPLVTLIVGMALLHESVSSLQLCGGMLILSSAVLVQFQKI